MEAKLNSVIFHTNNLNAVRSFYQEVLGLKVGEYIKDGQSVPDESENYVNFDLGGTLLCFEVESGRVGRGTVVVNVSDLSSAKAAIIRSGAKIVKDTPRFLIVQDPEERELILEPFDGDKK